MTLSVNVIGSGHLADAIRHCCNEVGHKVTTDYYADFIWYAENMPVDDEDNCDADAVLDGMAQHPLMNRVIISTQIPVGFTRRCEDFWPLVRFAYVPENIRRAHAVEDFRRQDRIVVGMRRAFNITPLLSPFTDRLLWMSPESAEMSKHVLNAYLALCITFANEYGELALQVSADSAVVYEALRTDHRVSNSAPLRPGEPITGGTLLRDVRVLESIHDEGLRAFPLIDSIWSSNYFRLGTDEPEPAA